MARLSEGAATFIVGHPRSGTSLLRALLDGHPRLLVLPFETHFLEWANSSNPVEHLLDRTRLLPTLLRYRASLSREKITRELEARLSHERGRGQRLTALVETWAAVTGRSGWARWVEKTPRHLYEIPRLLEWFGEETRVIAMRRDPRDVIASQLRQDPTRSLFGLGVTSRLAARVLRERAKDERVHVVSYEGLVHDTKRRMADVCDFLSLPFDDGLLTPTVMDSAYGGNSRFEPTLHGVSSSPAGRYRTALREDQLARAEPLLLPVLRDGGYEDSGTRAHIMPLQKAAAALIEHSGVWRVPSVRRAFAGF